MISESVRAQNQRAIRALAARGKVVAENWYYSTKYGCFYRTKVCKRFAEKDCRRVEVRVVEEEQR